MFLGSLLKIREMLKQSPYVLRAAGRNYSLCKDVASDSVTYKDAVPMLKRI